MTDDQEQGLPLAGAMALAAIALGAAAQGGFFPGALSALTALAVIALLVLGKVFVGAFEAACLAFGAWAVVTGALGSSVKSAVSTVAVCVAMASLSSAFGRFQARDRLDVLGGISIVGAIVALSGIVGVAVHREPFAIPSQHLWRAATSLTYANASAAFLSLTTLLALGFVIDRADRKRIVIATLSLGGLFATMSRAGIAAALLGGIVLLVVSRRFWAAVPPVLGAIVIFGSLVPSMLEEGPARPLFALVGVFAGVGIAILASTVPRRLLGGIVLAGVLAGTGLVIANPSTVDTIVAKRLNVESSARTESTKAALRVVVADPLTGAGPGRAPLIWRSADGDLLVARYVHNEYIQILADMGIPGGILLLWLLFVAAGTIRKGRDALPLPVWAAIVGGVFALCLHAGFDFLFHVPIIPITAAALVGSCAVGVAPAGPATVRADQSMEDR